MLLQKEILWRTRQKKIKLDQMAEEKTKGIARTELDGINQEKNVINIFSTFRKEVTTKDT